MSRVTRDRAAQRDLDEIWDYIAQESVAAANRLIDTIVETCNSLGSQPEMGQPRPELARNLRSFPVNNYIIFYRLLSSHSRRHRGSSDTAWRSRYRLHV